MMMGGRLKLKLPGKNIPLLAGEIQIVSAGTQTHMSCRIRLRAFQRYTAGGQKGTRPGRAISDIPRRGKSCTNANGPKLPVSRPVPVVYPAIAPASENCMRSYRLSDICCLDGRDLPFLSLCAIRSQFDSRINSPKHPKHAWVPVAKSRYVFLHIGMLS